ncbi:tetratricopeptide repeat protein 38 [Solanum pennellii]|uniref:Tetratricopeptide repeat protein 38 n=1 Tax=Solanum pennellii TaxID=28526 RepID=A0ABM1GR53_SOLPN|nr:tetratricopeptide repeat protein 38 [Solanum pennellii]
MQKKKKTLQNQKQEPTNFKKMEEFKVDKWGYQVKTSSDSCISAINSYYHQVLSYGRERSVILEAPKQDPTCVLANILAAHFLCSADSSRAMPLLEAAKSCLEQASLYEKVVFEVVSYLILPNRDDDVAIELHLKLLKDFPRDLVTVKRAQVLSFYMGRPDLSLKLVEQVLPVNKHGRYIYGMLAFALLELGRYAEAKEAAKKGFEIDSEDAWTHHALCHVYQYECRFKEAVQFMEECSRTWSSLSSFMYTHNWWHVALCYMEGHSPMEKVRDVYDQNIWKELERTDASSAEVYLNAVGLLLRVYIRGGINIFGDRLKILADRLTDKAFWYLEWHLDVLVLWALSYTGEVSKADELLEGLKSRISTMTKKKREYMQRAVLLAEVLFEYGKGENERALELLGQTFDAIDYKIIGASDEQLDVFNEVWITMLLNSGRATKAIEAIEMQLKKREGTPFLWRLLEKGYSSMSRNQEAIQAGKKAQSLEGAYFN